MTLLLHVTCSWACIIITASHTSCNPRQFGLLLPMLFATECCANLFTEGCNNALGVGCAVCVSFLESLKRF